MLDDKKCVTALLKIMNEHTMQGREVSAFVQLYKWVSELEDRLKPEVKAKPKPKPKPKKEVVK